MKTTAHDIASEPELFNVPCKIRGHVWECMGYNRTTGETVKFSRVIPLPGGGLSVKSIYVKPEQQIEQTNQ